ncbi:hypothetical protein HHI36_000588 [Cryptolaemus montrouzieri]|uniref:Uncharacterized protein n=1 Tax=Cryptolaemus montrouzieri TaxID=559131 RepID=A0ABD2P569_9CUCU
MNEVRDRLTKFCEGDNTDGVHGFLMLSIVLMYYGMTFLLQVKGNELIQFLHHISNPRLGFSKNFKTVKKFMELLSSSQYYLIFVANCINGVAYYALDVFCNEETRKENSGYVCGTMIPLWYPFSMDAPWKKYLCLLQTMITILSYLPILSCISTLFVGAVLFISIRMKQLQKFLKQVDPREGVKETEKKLKFCIQYFSEITE